MIFGFLVGWGSFFGNKAYAEDDKEMSDFGLRWLDNSSAGTS